MICQGVELSRLSSISEKLHQSLGRIPQRNKIIHLYPTDMDTRTYAYYRSGTIQSQSFHLKQTDMFSNVKNNIAIISDISKLSCVEADECVRVLNAKSLNTMKYRPVCKLRFQFYHDV